MKQRQNAVQLIWLQGPRDFNILPEYKWISRAAFFAFWNAVFWETLVLWSADVLFWANTGLEHLRLPVPNGRAPEHCGKLLQVIIKPGPPQCTPLPALILDKRQRSKDFTGTAAHQSDSPPVPLELGITILLSHWIRRMVFLLLLLLWAPFSASADSAEKPNLEVFPVRPPGSPPLRCWQSHPWTETTTSKYLGSRPPPLRRSGAYLSWEISWRPRPCPPEAEDSWDLEPVLMQMLPVHLHDVQDTEGPHPVGSMPEKPKRRRNANYLIGRSRK